MHAMPIPLDDPRTTIREVRTAHSPAVQRRVASATALSDTVTRLVVASLWS